MNRVLLKEGKHYTLGDEHSAFELTLDGLRFLIDAVADGNIVEARADSGHVRT